MTAFVIGLVVGCLIGAFVGTTLWLTIQAHYAEAEEEHIREAWFEYDSYRHELTETEGKQT